MKNALKTFSSVQTFKWYTSRPKPAIALVLMGVLWLLSTGVQAQSFAWARSVKGTYANTRIQVETNGDYMLAGEYKGDLWIGAYLSCGAGGTDVFVAHFNGVTGEPDWVKRMAGPEDDHLGDISYADGVLYVTGSFRGKATIDNFRTNDPKDPCSSFLSETLQSSGGSDIFIARYYVPTGALHWSARAGGLGNDEAKGLKVVGNINNAQLVLTGSFTKEASFYGIDAYNKVTKTITLKGEATYHDAFVAKYQIAQDGEGFPVLNLLWANRVGIGQGTDSGNAVDMDQAGNVYLTGSFSHTLSFYNQLPYQHWNTLSSNPQLLGYTDMFIAKYNASGLFQWANQAGGTSLDLGRDITVDAAGNAYVVGYHYGSNMIFYRNYLQAKIPVYALPNAGGMDGYLVKYNAIGEITWVRSVAGSKSDELTSVVRDASGHLFVTGSFTGNALAQSTGGNQALAATGGAADRELALIKYRADGVILWKMTGGGPVSNHGHAVGVDQAGRAYVSGYTDAGASFGAHPINATSVFVVRVNPPLDKLVFRTAAEETEQSVEEVGIKAYPVPATDNVTIEFVAETAEYTSVDVFDVQGIIKTNLFSGQTQAGQRYQLPLNVSQYTSGIYLVKRTSTTHAHQTKLTVLH
ncbi:MAG: T9SS type A sorting domain-containing protein [Bacteroidota bacterium]